MVDSLTLGLGYGTSLPHRILSVAKTGIWLNVVEQGSITDKRLTATIFHLMDYANKQYHKLARTVPGYNANAYIEDVANDQLRALHRACEPEIEQSFNYPDMTDEELAETLYGKEMESRLEEIDKAFIAMGATVKKEK